jgi:small redox-active disulfide protein 2
MEIKVLGPGCTKCKATVALIDTVAREVGVDVEVSKIETMREIVGYGVLSTPGVVIGDKVMHAGSVPSRDQVRAWLT